MKVTKGRGIQFFKQPFFSNHKKYFAEIYKSGRQGIGNVFSFTSKQNKEKKK